MLEIGRYNASAEVVGAGFRHCKNGRSLEYSNLCVIMATILCERGQDKSALVYNERVLGIRSELLDPVHAEIANAFSNYAISVIGTRIDLEKALAMLLKVLEIDMSNAKEDRDKVLHLQHYNLCFAYRALGDLKNARRELDLATKYVEAEVGKDSRYLNK